MNPQYLEDAKGLERHRGQYVVREVQDGLATINGDPMPELLLGDNTSGSESSSSQEHVQPRGLQSIADPFMKAIPNLYAPSGFDILSILIAVRNRPNPTFEIGALDSSVALTLCDAAHPDLPIVYCTESFSTLTGYTSSEIIGSNCRFLQSPPSCYPSPPPAVDEMNAKSKRLLKAKVAKGEDVQVQLVNFRKDGERFTNLLTCVPVELVDGDGRLGSYVVGLQADASNWFR